MDAPSPMSPNDESPTAALPGSTLVVLRGIAGGIVGGAIGYVVFRLLAQQGLYGMMIPGATLGLGASLAARRPSLALGVLCAIGAIVLAVVIEWSLFPFVKDKSFTFFVAHLHQLPILKLIMIGSGGVFAFWFGRGR